MITICGLAFIRNIQPVPALQNWLDMRLMSVNLLEETAFVTIQPINDWEEDDVHAVSNSHYTDVR